MFGISASIWRTRNVHSVPLFKQTLLPAVPQNQWQEAHLAKRYTRWEEKYPQHPMGVVLNHHKHPLVAITVSHNHPNLTAALTHFIGETSFTAQTASHQILFYRQPADPINHASPATLLDAEKHPALRLHSETEVLPLGSNIELPPSNLNTLPELTEELAVKVLDNLQQAHGFELSVTESEHSYNTSQIDVSLTITLTQLAYELMVNARPLIECLNELQAIYQSHTQNNQITPTPHSLRPFDYYRDKFYNAILTDVAQGRALLPPNWDEGMTPRDQRKLMPPFNRNHVQKDYDGIRRFTFTLLNDVIGDDSKVLQAVNVIIKQIALSTQLTRVEISNLKRFLSRQSGMKLDMTKLNSEILQQSKSLRRQDTLLNLSESLLEMLNRETDYRYDNEAFWAWNGAYWRKTEQNSISERLFKYFSCDLLTKSPITGQKAVLNHLKDALSQPLKSDNTPLKTGVNFANGYLTTDLTLLPHDKEMGLTYKLPYDYKPPVHPNPPPRFSEFLYTCWGRDDDYEDKVKALREAIAITLFGLAPAFQKVFLLHGVPETGKTQLLNIVSQIMPNLQRCAIPPERWGKNSNLIPLAQHLLNVCGELSETTAIQGDRFKEVVDGTEIAAGFNNKTLSNYLVKPKTAHWFASNHLPKADDSSIAFGRRWSIFRFSHPIAKREKQLNIGNRIAKLEGKEILNWSVQCLPETLQRGYTFASKSMAQNLEILIAKNSEVCAFYLDKNNLRIKDLSKYKRLRRAELLAKLNEQTAVCGQQIYQHFLRTRTYTQKNKKITFDEFIAKSEEVAAHCGFAIVKTTSNADEKVLFFGVDLRTERLGSRPTLVG